MQSPKRCDDNACRTFAWRSLVDCFIWGSSDRLSGTPGGGRSPHVRCVGAGLWRKRPSRGRRPRQAFGVTPCRRKVPRQRRKPLSRLRQACGGSPGLESPVLSGNPDGGWKAFSRGFSLGRKIPPNLTRLEETWHLAKSPAKRYGPWQAGPWYPGSHCADSSPRAHDGRARVVDEGEASRAQTRLPGP